MAAAIPAAVSAAGRIESRETRRHEVRGEGEEVRIVAAAHRALEGERRGAVELGEQLRVRERGRQRGRTLCDRVETTLEREEKRVVFQRFARRARCGLGGEKGVYELLRSVAREEV